MKLKYLFIFVFLILSFSFNANISNAVRPDIPGKKQLALTTKPTRTTEGKTRSCETRETAIKNRMANLTELVSNMIDVFNRKTTKVQDYYTNSLVPQGTTLSNYNDLVANIETEKADVQTTLTKAQADVDNFSCAAGDPKVAMQQFRTDMQAVKSALHDFRKSIRDLLVAVRSSASEEK